MNVSAAGMQAAAAAALIASVGMSRAVAPSGAVGVAGPSGPPPAALRDVVVAQTFEAHAVDRMLAMRAYEANAAALRTHAELLEAAIDLA